MTQRDSKEQTANQTSGEADVSSGKAGNGKYQVGYKRPPIHSRFQPGQSGYPAGRPKGRPNAKTTVKRVIDEKVLVREGKKTRSMTKLEGLLQAQTMKGMKGDARSANIIFGLIARMGLLAELEEEPRKASLNDEPLDFRKAPIERVRRFRDLMRKATKDLTALSHDELDELREIKLSMIATKE